MIAVKTKGEEEDLQEEGKKSTRGFGIPTAAVENAIKSTKL